jgi:hypothetical protein
MTIPRDDIPEDVKRTLRREVGFGCPICRIPFLKWHHFDPPYRVCPHNNPEGMIALCAEHSDEADNNNWSIEQLRALKKKELSGDDIRGTFPSWAHSNVLVRIGRSYCGGCRSILHIGGTPIIALSKNTDNMLSLSFSIWDPDGTLLATMTDNVITVSTSTKHLYDLEAPPRKRGVGIWFGHRKIGLKLTFERLSMDELSSLLESDKAATDNQVIEQLPPEALSAFQEHQAGAPYRIGALGSSLELPPHLLEAIVAKDPVGTAVKRWALQNCTESDGLIPFLNFERMNLWFHKQQWSIGNTINPGNSKWHIGYNAFLDGGGCMTLPCFCSACTSDTSGTGATQTRA